MGWNENEIFKVHNVRIKTQSTKIFFSIGHCLYILMRPLHILRDSTTFEYKSRFGFFLFFHVLGRLPGPLDHSGDPKSPSRCQSSGSCKVLGLEMSIGLNSKGTNMVHLKSRQPVSSHSLWMP